MLLDALVFLHGFFFCFPGGKGNHFSPLLSRFNYACHSENLRRSFQYTCNPNGDIVCLPGWSHPEFLCKVPICTEGCGKGQCTAPNVCKCNPGWGGKNCRECRPSIHCMNGFCVHSPRECICRPGWAGKYCDRKENNCQHGKYLSNDHCICDPGWFGRNCSRCHTHPRCVWGTCKSIPGECICNPGWSGDNCNLPICGGDCNPEHGFCFKPDQCICRSGWHGDNCDLCTPMPGCEKGCRKNEPWTCEEEDIWDHLEEIWSEWSSWSKCSKSCGDGIMQRKRDCHKGGSLSSCAGNAVEEVNCNEKYCEIDGHWSLWTSWSVCSVSCGTGLIKRIRLCNNPYPKYGGHPCLGKDEELKQCSYRECPKDGGWSQWEDWSLCSRPCDGGYQNRQRFCNSPIPEHGGKYCFGLNYETNPCNHDHCDNHVHWLKWGDWSSCSLSCGNGYRTRTRRCSSFNATVCLINEKIEHESCYSYCDSSQLPHHSTSRVQGHWSAWEPWSQCSTSCGVGISIRERLCNNPIPSEDGKPCPGVGHESKICFGALCNDNENHWGLWTLWSKCSLTCGRGTRIRTRKCLHPEDHSRSCKGSSREKGFCFVDFCPIHGEWGPWKQWSDCSATCGEGTKTRIRKCNNPAPERNGKPCLGLSMQKGDCLIDYCKVGSHWNPWGEWSNCNATCGYSEKTRTRECVGKVCNGFQNEIMICSTKPCSWGNWLSWSPCSKSCDAGKQYRHRKCKKEICEGSNIQDQICNIKPCKSTIAASARWSSWTDWTTCSAKCKGNVGTRLRHRKCLLFRKSVNFVYCPGKSWKRAVCHGKDERQNKDPDATCYEK